MKRKIILLAILTLVLTSTPPLFSQDSNNEIIDDNAMIDFSGEMVISDGELLFTSDNCAYKDQKYKLKGFNRKKFNHKRWKRIVNKAEDKILKNVLIKGLVSEDGTAVLVKKITRPLKKPKIVFGSSASGLYLKAAVELYEKTIELREKYKVFSVDIKEVEDPELGKVTEYSIYDSKCKKLTPEEIKNISDKDLDGLNNAVKIGGGLLLKQAALTGLAALSTKEIANANPLLKAAYGRNAGAAGIRQVAIIAQLPKIVKNLKESKEHIEKLRAE